MSAAALDHTRACPQCGKSRGADAFKGGHDTYRWCRMLEHRGDRARPTLQARPATALDQARTFATTARRCHFCQETKPVSQFTPHPRDRGEYLPYCHDCKPAWNRWRLKHPDEVPEFALEPHTALVLADPTPTPAPASDPVIIAPVGPAPADPLRDRDRVPDRGFDGDFSLIYGLCKRLPKAGRWTSSERGRWLVALEAVVDLLVPVEDVA